MTAAMPKEVTDAAQFSLGKYLKDASVFGLAQQLLKLSSLVTLPLITKKLGVDQYGLLTLTNALSGFLVWFVLWSFPSATVRLLVGEKDPYRMAQVHHTALIFIAGSGLVWYAIAWPFMEPLSVYFFGHAHYAILVHLSILSTIVTAAVNLLMAVYRIREENVRYTRIDVVFNLLATALTVAILLIVDNVVPVVVALVLFKTLRSFWLLIQFVRMYGWARPSIDLFRPYLKFCMPLLIPQIMAWSMNLSDRFFLSHYFDAETVGIYTANYNLPILLNHLVLALFFSFTPAFARLWNAGDHTTLRRDFARTANIMLAIGLPMAVGMSLLCTPLMTLLTTPEVGQASWQVVPFVAFAYLFVGLGGYGSEVFMYLKKTGTTGWFATGAALLNLLGNALLIPQYGVLGASISTAMAFALQSLITTYMAQRLFAFHFDGPFIFKIVISTAGMGIILFVLPSDQTWHALVKIPVGGILYILFLYILQGCPSGNQIRALLRS